MRSFIAVALIWYFLAEGCFIMADVGTATSYDPPYLPTKCQGYNKDNLPEGGLFVAASSGVWDNGAACGRRYRVRCLSGHRRQCKYATIIVEVVDMCRNNPCPATLVLPSGAFNLISKNSDETINIEFAKV